MSTILVALASALLVAAQTPATFGSLAGCMSDSRGQRLPGATVTANGIGAQRTTVADTTGCYELNNLPVGRYRVTAQLTGFDNVTHQHVEVGASTRKRVDFAMATSPICECVRIGGSLADHWRHADAVLHLRIAEPAGHSPVAGSYQHGAIVLTALKWPGGSRQKEPTVVLQNQRSGTPVPFEIGQEVLMFLESFAPHGFRITNDEPGLSVDGGNSYAMVFLIHDKRIQSAPSEFRSYIGTPVGRFLDELRALRRK